MADHDYYKAEERLEEIVAAESLDSDSEDYCLAVAADVETASVDDVETA